MNVEELYKQGVEFFKEKDYWQAIEYFEKIPEANGKYFNAVLWIGISYYFLEKYQLSIDYWKKIPETDDNYFDAVYWIGVSYDSLEKHEQAIEYFEKIPETDENYFDAIYWIGDSYYFLEKYEQAIDYWKKIPETNDNYFDAIYWIGDSYYFLEKYEQAIEYYKKIPETDDNLFDVAYWIGVSYYYLNQSEKAAEYYVNAKKGVFEVLNYVEDIEGIEKIVPKMLDLLNDDSNDFFYATLKKGNIGKDKLAPYKNIYVKVLQVIFLLHVKGEQEQEFSHYTRKTVAEALLFSKPNVKEEKEAEIAKFRLSSAITGNDPKEGETLLDFLEVPCPETPPEENDYRAFIGCFTFNPDSLNQYRLYGKENDKEATGVSIVVNKNFFADGITATVKTPTSLRLQNDKFIIEEKEPEEKEPEKQCLLRCIYLDPETGKVISLGQKEEYVFYRDNKKIASKKITKYQRDLANKKNGVQKQLDDLKGKIKTGIEGKKIEPAVICELLLPLRYLVKHVAFKEEQECRILDIERLTNSEKVKYEDGKLFIEYLCMANYANRVFFAPKTPGYEVFRDRAIKEGKRFPCRQSRHPFAL